MTIANDDLVPVGRVAGTHGLRGDLKVRLTSEDPASILSVKRVFFRLDNGTTVEHVPCRAVMHKGNALLRLRGLEHINEVQFLLGTEVLLLAEDLPELPEGDYRWHELEGMTVEDKSTGEIGVLEDSFSTAAHEIYVVRGAYGEVLIPVVPQMIVDVDPESRRILVDLPEGLIQKSDDV